MEKIADVTLMLRMDGPLSTEILKTAPPLPSSDVPVDDCWMGEIQWNDELARRVRAGEISIEHAIGAAALYGAQRARNDRIRADRSGYVQRKTERTP